MNPIKLDLRMLLISLIVAATAIPVEFRAFDMRLVDTSANAPDMALNAVGYMPLGLCLASLGTTAGMLAAGLVSGIAEASQFFAMGRFPSPLDLLCNVAGALLGMLIARRCSMTFTLLHVGRRVAGAAAVGAAMLMGLLALPGKQATLENWDPGMQLAIGDELTHDRPWQGWIRELAILPGSLDRKAISSLANGESFSNLTVRPVYGPVSDLDAAQIRGAPLLPIGRLRQIHDVIVDLNAFTVLVRFRIEDTNQSGPARIVTYSRDPMNRNFTLGQENRDLVFRLRTQVSGLNGMQPELKTIPVVSSGREMFVACSYDGQISRVFVDGKLVGRTNLSAAGKRFPELADVHLPAIAVAVGSLTAIAMLGFWTPATNRLRLVASLSGGLAGGLLLQMSGGASTLPLYAPWATALGGGGGLLIAASIETRS